LNKTRTAVVLALSLLAAITMASTAQAQEGPGFHGWGLRGGVSDRPDQLLVGVQADFGELIENLRFEPNVELGVGDDQTILSLSAPVFYRWPESGPFDFYGGGGIAVGFVDRDEEEASGEGDGFELVIAPLLAAGLAWPVGESEAGVELAVTANELQNVKLVFRWMF
jgi:opacity protein-like surface antigen